jgi:hypothetical protein
MKERLYGQYNDVDDVVKHQKPVPGHYWFEVNLQPHNNEKVQTNNYE